MKIVFLSLICLSLNGYAQISRNFKKTEKPQYEVGFGLIRLEAPNYPGASNTTPRTLPFPWIIYRGDYLQADEEGTRAKFFESDNLELGMSAGFNFPIRESDNEARTGMAETDALIGVGPSLIYRLFKETNIQRLNLGIGFRGNASTNFTNTLRFQGFLIEPSIRYWRKISEKSKITILAGLSASFSDQEYADFFYTIKSKYETSERKAFKAKSGLIDIAATFGFSYDFSKKMSFFSGLVYSNLSLAANKKSYLVEDEHNIGTLFGFSWLFYESDLMVR